MKKTLVLFFVFAFELISCSPPTTPKASSTNTLTEPTNYLVYLTSESPNSQKLVFYDPVNDTRSQILHDWKINDFSISANNRLAFSSSQEGANNIYILDFPFTENTPIKISLNPTSDFVRPSWSPNGYYLLFDSVQGDNKSLLLWDGKDVFDIYDYQQHVNEISWGPNNQLAFTDFSNSYSPNDGDPSEVFIWDGNMTVSASQNPTGEDRYPAWDKNGRLAFLSNRNGEHNIYVWDGKSKNNGAPDINTFLNIAPDLTHYYSDLTWTNSGSLAFEGSSKWDLSTQIYEWDGQTTTNISRNPLNNNGGQTWRSDGYWAFVTYFSEAENLYIRDEKNSTVLKTKGKYTPAWSRNGLLMFCVDNHPSWTLAIWNGKDVIDVVRGTFVVAKWQSGTGVYCSNG